VRDYLIVNTDSGRQEQFERLMGTYAPALRRFCRAQRSDAGDGQDLFQEIAMALWRALPGFRGEASERTWIYRIAQNVAFSDAARRRRRRSREVPLEHAPEAGSAESERRRELFDAVHRLDPVERELAWLYLEGLTAREIGEVLGITEGNAAVRLTRLRQQLARMLNAGEVER
jgi:RNA polymerase sigma-70 factor (ECF subfamily)